MTAEYIIYCDESDARGRHYSNFYGGALVRSIHIDEVRSEIARKKTELHFFGEVKWSKITVPYTQKYIDLIDFFFDFIRDEKIKIRIMFTQNMVKPLNLTAQHYENQYLLLYYQFIRHAFGLQYSPSIPGGVRIRVYPDRIPSTKAQISIFKTHLCNLSKRQDFRSKGLSIKMEDVAEVTSHEHDILQCLDIILGAINFRMNDKHLDKPEGARNRSKKTLERLRLYKHINKRIREIYPNFNVGISTGQHGDPANRWSHAYRHWLFRSKAHEITKGGGKKKKRKRAGTP